MNEETTTDVTTDAPVENNQQNINISIEQICAAILSVMENVEVPLEYLLADYSGKSIAINQDQETKAVTFSIVNVPAAPLADEEVAADVEKDAEPDAE